LETWTTTHVQQALLDNTYTLLTTLMKPGKLVRIAASITKSGQNKIVNSLVHTDT
jgi:hypothetical protein